jgi:hypothetical protein
LPAGSVKAARRPVDLSEFEPLTDRLFMQQFNEGGTSPSVIVGLVVWHRARAGDLCGPGGQAQGGTPGQWSMRSIQ